MSDIRTNLLIAMISLLFLSGIGFAAQASLKDDAYHYHENGPADPLYNEWWYFNWISNDTQAQTSYFVSDPENVTGMRRIMVLTVVLKNGSYPAIGLIRSNSLDASRHHPDVQIGSSGISSENDPDLRIWGTSTDMLSGMNLAWDLNYQPAAEPWFGIPVKMHVGHIEHDWLKWLTYMPSANVTGTLTLGSNVYNITAKGYHDHNWGSWAFNDPQWNWAQVSKPEDGFSLTLGDLIGEQRNTMMGVNYRGESARFSDEQIQYNYTNFALDTSTARTYPTEYSLTADNGDYQVNARITVLKSLPQVVVSPLPQPSYVVFGQVSRIQGTLQPESGPAYQFDTLGFTEYTTHKLHPIYGRVNSTNVAGVTINATNLRTGQVKTVNAATGGWYSFDADYVDYLTNSTAPWVATGETVHLVAKDTSGNSNSTDLIIDMSSDRQMAPQLNL